MNKDILEVAYLDAIEVKAKDAVELPSTVWVTLGDNDTTTEVQVQWDVTTFDEEGTYVSEGTLQLTDGITNTKGHSAYQVVHVTAE